MDPSTLRAVFLDRDGVVNRRRRLLVREPRQVALADGAGTAIARLNAAGYLVLVATNQDGVAYGWVGDLDGIHRELDRQLAPFGARIDRYYACTHRRDAGCGCRKPGTGLLELGAREWGLAPERCWMVGDRPTDVEAGRAFRCRTVWITGGRLWPWENRWRAEADAAVRGLMEAVEFVLRSDRGESGRGGLPPRPGVSTPGR